jgi:twitching motility protein PilT
MDIKTLLKYAVDHKASDLHLSSEMIPMVRVDGMLEQVAGATKVSEANFAKMVLQLLGNDDAQRLNGLREVDKTFVDPDYGRFRINIFRHSNGLGVALRVIHKEIPTCSELGLSDIFYKLCDQANGLIILAGPTGSGKTTTIASMLQHINSTKSGHIITLEDPIEYLHECNKCLIHQREVGSHTESFNGALRAVLREDPNYIFVGEMRDAETIRLTLTAAETGHLVFATLHTSSAAETINRVIDVFQPAEKAMVRSVLASSLRGVISQVLVKRKGGGRIAVQEVMICSPAVKNMIREDKVHQIYSVIQTGQEMGMRTLEQHMLELSIKGLIERE